MEKFLRPPRFDCSPDDPTAASQWSHWHQTFVNFLSKIPRNKNEPVDKLLLLTNFVTPAIYEFINGIKDFDSAIKLCLVYL